MGEGLSLDELSSVLILLPIKMEGELEINTLALA